MEFIGRGTTLQCAVEFLKQERNEIDLAVAFWGRDATSRLEIEKWEASSVRIICNATSGACSPEALEFLMKRFGSQLKTNPKLHAKVYWTPAKLLITSANASASGLALDWENNEVNIEAGVAITSREIIKEVKDWFDETYQSPKTEIVDQNILKIAKQMWANRQNGPQPDRELSLTDALRNKELVFGRNIWVINYEPGERSSEGRQQHDKLQREWKAKRERPPEAIGADIRFTMIEDYEELGLRGYHWKSWVIDLNEVPAFWFVPDKNRVIKNRRSKTVPRYGTRRISFGSPHGIKIGNQDMTHLRRMWKTKQGEKNDRWVPLEEFAES
jgi:hypothetical protein